MGRRGELPNTATKSIRRSHDLSCSCVSDASAGVCSSSIASTGLPAIISPKDDSTFILVLILPVLSEVFDRARPGTTPEP